MKILLNVVLTRLERRVSDDRHHAALQERLVNTPGASRNPKLLKASGKFITANVPATALDFLQ
jgi:hypothetical protein